MTSRPVGQEGHCFLVDVLILLKLTLNEFLKVKHRIKFSHCFIKGANMNNAESTAQNKAKANCSAVLSRFVASTA